MDEKYVKVVMDNPILRLSQIMYLLSRTVVVYQDGKLIFQGHYSMIPGDLLKYYVHRMRNGKEDLIVDISYMS